MKMIEGNLVAQGLKIGIVVGRFNNFIVSKFIYNLIIEQRISVSIQAIMNQIQISSRFFRIYQMYR